MPCSATSLRRVSRWLARLTDIAPFAYFGGRLATELKEVTHDLADLDASGWWAVQVTFEGELTAARFSTVVEADLPAADWPGVAAGKWSSSMSRAEYLAAVESVRESIAAGDVYQANICRVLQAPFEDGKRLAGLARLLDTHHSAPHGGTLVLPDHGVFVASASPELFLSRMGNRIRSSPIKGTARQADELLDKDTAENVMIVDLVRNDLGRVCETGSIGVPELLHVEEHPGLVHLVSSVEGTLRSDVGWPEILDGTFPPGSVTGAPKSSALRIIGELETAERGPYCGAVGWVDADAGTAELAVGIRTFWVADGHLRFGTGAGITWGSDPEREWDETTLKAERLLSIAARRSSR